MSKTNSLLATMLTTIIFAGLFVATPAHASRETLSFPDCTNGTLNGASFAVPSGATSLEIAFTNCPAQTPPSTPNFAIDTSANPPASSTRANFPGALDLNVSFAIGPNPRDNIALTTSVPRLIPDGTYVVFFGWYPGAGANNFGSFVINVGGGGGGGGASSSTAPPQTFELSLVPSDGTVCSKSSQSGSEGSWITLPGTNACTPPRTKPNAKLLGWATSPTFSIDIATRQVANGWGAYETFNEVGQMTSLFIPAGSATYLSASGKLYAIWSE
jgi:hypothetical protein